MSRLPVVTGEKTVRTLAKAGFQPVRQKGSHVYLKHRDGRATVIPIHKGKDIDRGLLKKILKDTELSGEEFVKLLT